MLETPKRECGKTETESPVEATLVMLSKLRYAYVPVSRDLTHPIDRRRFGFYANRRGLRFDEGTPDGSWDVIVLSQRADLSQWQGFPKNRGKLVFDFVDSYLAVPPRDVRGMFRGLAKFAVRQNRHLHLNYTELLRSMCRRSDAVVCSTEEQRQQILEFCPNVHVILDCHATAVRRIKEDYARGDTFNLVWEGMGGNVSTFRVIADVLDTLRRKQKLALHLVTDLDYPLGLYDMWKVPTAKLIRRVVGARGTYLYQWNESMMSAIACACDLAVIPIPVDIPIYAGKPENKLLLFWRMGVPVVTSATPAYVRTMRAAGLPMTCADAAEWAKLLTRYMDDEDARREAGCCGRAYVEECHNDQAVLKRWDDVFASVL